MTATIRPSRPRRPGLAAGRPSLLPEEMIAVARKHANVHIDTSAYPSKGS